MSNFDSNPQCQRCGAHIETETAPCGDCLRLFCASCRRTHGCATLVRTLHARGYGRTVANGRESGSK